MSIKINVRIQKLQTLAPHLKKLCSQLAEYKIPPTLVYEDLHLGNVALHNNKYLIFDWTDSCISHPLFDMFPLFFPQKKKPFLSSLSSLRDEYLSQWEIYESKPHLLEAWKLAKPLCALHHAVTYQHITACLEPRAKQECNALLYFLRQLLKCKI
ncbi:MAG: phosphotransferase [Okeania sp. SIO1H4]|nr:phosphotransferase [Okeania sp. SIO1H4]NET21867.1 phosphotransferase [Okeania sp. SIO1H5]NET94782.1 phosphotransferase [Okeania sp. SIO1H2]